jgi:hypothetical protein
MTPPRLHLVDTVEGPGRTTATLIASLAARLGVLHLVSGADAIGSIAAGIAALGRSVSQTVEGARLRSAIEKSRPGTNGDMLWTTLRMRDWISTSPPAPVLDQMRNDLALLLADDLEETLAMLPIPHQSETGKSNEPAPTSHLDFLIGMWAFSAEVMRSVEALAHSAREASADVVPGSAGAFSKESLLR